MDAVNADPDTLSGHTLQLKAYDSGGTEWKGLRATCEFAHDGGVHAIVGPALSRTSVGVGKLCGAFQLPCISYASTSEKLSDTAAYPYFARVVSPDSRQALVMVDTVKHFGWERICVVYQDDDYGTMGAVETVKQAKAQGIEVISLHPYEHVNPTSSTDAIADAGKNGCFVFVLWCIDCKTPTQQALDLGYVKSGTYVWLMSEGCSFGDAFGDAGGANPLAKALVGSLCVSPTTPESAAKQAFKTQAWPASPRGAREPDTYTLSAYDAVLVAAHALDAVPAAAASPFSVGSGRCLTYPADVAPWAHGPAVRDAMKSVSVAGALTSGDAPLRLNGDLERDAASYEVLNMQSYAPGGGNLRLVGEADVADGAADVRFPFFIQWGTPDNAVPPDRLAITSRTVRVITQVGAPPFSELDPENPECDACREAAENNEVIACPTQACYVGLTVDFFRLVAEDLGFTFAIEHLTQDTGYTSTLNASLTGNGEYDIAIGDYTVTASRSEFIDWSIFYYDLGLTILMAKNDNQVGGYKYGMWSFTLPFANDLWAFIGIYILVAAFFFWLFEHGHNNHIPGLGDTEGEKLSDGLQNSLFWSFTAFFQTHNYGPSLPQ